MSSPILPVYVQTERSSSFLCAICSFLRKFTKLREKSLFIIIIFFFGLFCFIGILFLPEYRPLVDRSESLVRTSFLSTKSIKTQKSHLPIHGSSIDNLSDSFRRKKIIEMAKFAWDMYSKYAWGHNELRPISKNGHSANIFGQSKMGATIIDSLDTLYLMGLMDEYNEGRRWVEEKFSFEPLSDVSVFEINIRFIGGLLSCYALTKDELFKEKAIEIADKLMPAFDSPTGIPYAIYNPRTGVKRNWSWASGGCSILSEFGTLHLEYAYLSNITKNTIYFDKVSKIRETIYKTHTRGNVYPNYFNPESGRWGQRHTSLGALGDSFYEYLIKSFRQNRSDTLAKEMYDEAIQTIEAKLTQRSESGLLYFAEMKNGRLEHKMDHLACFTGGMLGLGAKYSADESKYMKMAEEIAHTCHESYVRSETHIGPEAFRFESGKEARAQRYNEMYYIHRPEVIETYFYMWKLTKNPKYKEWAWDAAQSIEKYCKIENGGYSGIKNVYEVNPVYDDVQQSFIIAETFKYLFLIFSSDSTLDIEKYVFNSEAHPLPVLK